MYDLIQTVIDHVFDMETASQDEQLLIYAISGTVICIVFVWVLDSITRFIINFGRKGGR